MIWIINEFVLLVLAFGSMMAVLEAGFRLGKRASADTDADARDHVGMLQGSVLGLFALLLGFSFAMAVDRFELRKALVVEEANAIGTTVLRAEFLPEPQGQVARQLLKGYVAARLAFYAAGMDPVRLEAAQAWTARIQQDLWGLTVKLAEQAPRSIPVGLFIETLNEMIDDSEKRSAALGNHVPEVVIGLLFAVAGTAMGLVAYRSGLSRHRRLGQNTLLALLIAVVITIIIDIDRPRSGLVHVSQGSMLRLKESLDSAESGSSLNSPALHEGSVDVPAASTAKARPDGQ